MNIPTDSQIQAAYDVIYAEGPQSPATMALGGLILTNSNLRRVCQKVADLSGVPLPLIVGPFLCGLHIGLLIDDETKPIHE